MKETREEKDLERKEAGMSEGREREREEGK